MGRLNLYWVGKVYHTGWVNAHSVNMLFTSLHLRFQMTSGHCINHNVTYYHDYYSRCRVDELNVEPGTCESRIRCIFFAVSDPSKCHDIGRS